MLYYVDYTLAGQIKAFQTPKSDCMKEGVQKHAHPCIRRRKLGGAKAVIDTAQCACNRGHVDNGTACVRCVKFADNANF